MYLKCFGIRTQLRKIYTIFKENCISFYSVLARGIEIQQYADDTKESIHVQEAIAYIRITIHRKLQ